MLGCAKRRDLLDILSPRNWLKKCSHFVSLMWEDETIWSAGIWRELTKRGSCCRKFFFFENFEFSSLYDQDYRFQRSKTAQNSVHFIPSYFWGPQSKKQENPTILDWIRIEKCFQNFRATCSFFTLVTQSSDHLAPKQDGDQKTFENEGSDIDSEYSVGKPVPLWSWTKRTDCLEQIYQLVERSTGPLRTPHRCCRGQRW